MTMRSLKLLVLFSVLGGGVAAFAQEAPTPPLRDLTVPAPGSAALRRPDPVAAREADPTRPQPVVPALVLRGLVAAKGRPAVAVVEIGGSLLRRVSAGDEVVWTDAAGGALVLRVESLTADEVRVSVPSLERVLVLR